MKVLRTGVLLLLAASSFSAMAQDKKEEKVAVKTRLSGGLEAGLPVGKLSDSHDYTLGAAVQVEVPVSSDKLFITGNAGYVHYVGKSAVADLNVVPVKAGLRVYPAEKFYLGADAGAAFLVNKGIANGDKSAAFIYAPHAGYVFNVGAKKHLDTGVRFESTSKFYDAGKSQNVLALRVAYAFSL